MSEPRRRFLFTQPAHCCFAGGRRQAVFGEFLAESRFRLAEFSEEFFKSVILAILEVRAVSLWVPAAAVAGPAGFWV